MSYAADTGSVTEARWGREGYKSYRLTEHISDKLLVRVGCLPTLPSVAMWSSAW